MHCKGKRGFTLIEMTLVMTIIAVLIGIGFVSMGRFLIEARRDQLSEEIISVLRRAKRETLSRNNGTNYGVHFDSDAFTLFPGSAYVENNPENEPHVLPDGFRLASVSLSGGGNDVVFLLFTGETNTYGSLVVEHEENLVASSTIRVYETGVAEIQ